MTRDLFPSTPATWIASHLADGADGRSEVNRHIMRIYARPLRAYFERTRERWLRGGTEIVHGFFADRLDRPQFFAGWQSSGMPLRQWLKNSFCFYLREETRRRRRDTRVAAADLATRGNEPPPEEAFDRAYAQEIVREALVRTARECEEHKLSLHWRVFIEHFYRGVPYAECGPSLGLTEEQAAVKARSAVRRFRTNVRELIARGSFAPGRIDEELLSLLEVTA